MLARNAYLSGKSVVLWHGAGWVLADENVSLGTLIAFMQFAALFAQPEVKVGCLPPIACARLAARTAPAVAADLILTGSRLDAARALALGLVSRVGPLDDELARLPHSGGLFAMPVDVPGLPEPAFAG